MRNVKKKRLLALLLEMDKDNKTKSALAKKIGSSRTWIIKFLREMTEKKYVRDFEVINPKAIFDLFHLLQNKKRTVRSYSIADTPAFLNWMIMTKVKREYAFTTYQAENMVQQYLFPHKIEFYVKKEDVEAWHHDLSAKGLYGGGNVSLIVEEYDELFNKRKIGKWWIVNIPQLISDLFRENGPATEAGEMLFEKMVLTIKK